MWKIGLCRYQLFYFTKISVNDVDMKVSKLETGNTLGCGTVRVELKFRFTGYRLPFTVSRYGLKKQDGNVPSRRHILGSKIFKEQLLEKFGKKFFSKKIFDFFSKKKYFLGRTMPKNSKRGHSGSFNVFYKPKTSKKFKGVPFDKFRKFSKKVA